MNIVGTLSHLELHYSFKLFTSEKGLLIIECCKDIRSQLWISNLGVWAPWPDWGSGRDTYLRTSQSLLSFPLDGEIKPLNVHSGAKGLCLTVCILILYSLFFTLFHHLFLVLWTSHLPDLTYIRVPACRAPSLVASTPSRPNSQKISLEPSLNALGRYKLENCSSLTCVSLSQCLNSTLSVLQW